MKYIDVINPGGPEALTLCEGEAPRPRAGEVLIKVSAAGVNRPDVMQRQGNYPPPPGASPIIGLEVAGEVVALGEGTKLWRKGDMVCALTNGGGYAEYAAVPATQCLPIPAGLSFVEAASLPETFFTVWVNAFDIARLQKGETFLVHGGTSGIGTAAIPMARAFGARIFATAGSEEKCRACIRMGAEIAINYREQDFVEKVKEATDGKGVNVIMDMVGGDYIPRNIEAAAEEGRIVYINFMAGSRVEVDFRPVLFKRLILTGSALRPRTTEAKGRIAQALKDNIWPLLESGEIKPVIAATFPLYQVSEAHRLMESSTHIGKIVLTVSE